MNEGSSHPHRQEPPGPVPQGSPEHPVPHHRPTQTVPSAASAQPTARAFSHTGLAGAVHTLPAADHTGAHCHSLGHLAGHRRAGSRQPSPGASAPPGPQGSFSPGGIFLSQGPILQSSTRCPVIHTPALGLGDPPTFCPAINNPHPLNTGPGPALLGRPQRGPGQVS